MIIKNRILFLQPLYFDPTLPNFKDKFEMLSEYFEGDVISASNKKYDGLKFGDFDYHALPYIRRGLHKYPYYLWKTISIGLKLHRRRRFDFIHCYDPLFFGLTGAILKFFTKAKLIIEINGHYDVAGFLKERSLKARLKKIVFYNLIPFCFRRADLIKFLNGEQKKGYERFITSQKVCMFHDFVATHVFDPQRSLDGRYILFLGHPFHIKGVDILIKAFNKIYDEFPDLKLKIVGHCHGGEVERDQYKKIAISAQVEILHPVFFNEAVTLIEQCTFFVLPSRTEAMGRVLIEAMAAGKAVIGSNVGGIPTLITDVYNGFLFDSQDVRDLSERMRLLLLNDPLRENMGKRNIDLVANKFSSRKYVEYFTNMIEGRDERNNN